MRNPQFLFRILLTLHIIGIIVMAGTTVVDYMTFKIFCRLADQRDDRSVGLLSVMSKFGILVRAGAGTIILTSIGLLVLSKDILRQPWFRLKLMLVTGLFLHGMLVGNPHGMKFRSLVAENKGHLLQEIASERASLDRFYIIQLVLFLVIIFLSVIAPGSTDYLGASKIS
ncbi:MAG TPA: hypothetical protein VL727_21115 [Puia sp.]|nr:hypothetical protein [Puia sp.]